MYCDYGQRHGYIIYIRGNRPAAVRKERSFSSFLRMSRSVEGKSRDKRIESYEGQCRRMCDIVRRISQDGHDGGDSFFRRNPCVKRECPVRVRHSTVSIFLLLAILKFDLTGS